jgi:ABC-type cobalamin/Fe3+-siderophores transport system ATPase subunit
MPPKDKKNDIKAWYKIMPEYLIPKYHNPCYDNHKISIPARLIIVGCSGSGKTTLALEIIYRMKHTFGNISVCSQNKNEPLYNFLSSKIDEDQLQFYEGIENIPRLEDLDSDVQHLVIFDDLVTEKKQDAIAQYFVRGRKIAKGVSILYLSQNYYGVPKVCRINSTGVILKKLSTVRDLSFVLKDHTLDLTKEQMMKMYQDCTSDGGFLFIDVAGPPEERYRHNFLENITPSQENSNV